MFKLLAVLLIAAGLCSCASDTTASNSADRVSTIPWNRPQTWEGQGVMGGFMPGRQ